MFYAALGRRVSTFFCYFIEHFNGQLSSDSWTSYDSDSSCFMTQDVNCFNFFDKYNKNNIKILSEIYRFKIISNHTSIARRKIKVFNRRSYISLIFKRSKLGDRRGV